MRGWNPYCYIYLAFIPFFFFTDAAWFPEWMILLPFVHLGIGAYAVYRILYPRATHQKQ